MLEMQSWEIQGSWIRAKQLDALPIDGFPKTNQHVCAAGGRKHVTAMFPHVKKTSHTYDGNLSVGSLCWYFRIRLQQVYCVLHVRDALIYQQIFDVLTDINQLRNKIKNTSGSVKLLSQISVLVQSFPIVAILSEHIFCFDLCIIAVVYAV